MSDLLPPELIDSVLSHLCGTPTIAACALVCHSWLPSARYHLLSPPKVLHLNQIQIAEFLHLIDSPRSTLSLLSFSTLHLEQNKVVWGNPINPNGKAWRNDTAVCDFFVRNLTSPSITSLFLEWIDWRTLSPTALASLHNSYKSVKELELRCIAFTFPEFCNLITALTALEKITAHEGVPFGFGSPPLTVNSVQIRHPSLCKLAFRHPPSWMIRFFTGAIEYTAGIVGISIDISLHAQDDEWQQFQACRELLGAAGTSLRALKLIAPYHPLPGDDAVSFAELLAFPRNTNLQEIELLTFDKITLRLFLQCLKLNVKPKLRQLKLGITDTDNLVKWAETWVLADEALSTMSLKDPKLILELPSLRGGPGIWHHYSDNIEPSDSTHAEDSLKTLKNLMPRIAQRWTLEVEFRD
ncbi:hypothetical protein FPV67DRAFT_1672341 [Lyophyllum atratum]|nr:hypothetical protein FPV67DRAFT_1672341 [Lyophyllum atratum]